MTATRWTTVAAANSGEMRRALNQLVLDAAVDGIMAYAGAARLRRAVLRRPTLGRRMLGIGGWGR